MKAHLQNKDSEILWVENIPTHWDMWKVKFVSFYQNGAAFKSDLFRNDGNVFVIRIGDLVSSKVSLENATTITKENAEGFENVRLKKNDILLALTGATIGKSSLFELEEECYLNQRVALFRPRKNISKEYLMLFIDSDVFRTHIDFECYGGAQENVGKSQILNAKLPLPPLPEQRQIAAYLDYKTKQIDRFIANRKKQIELLEERIQNKINETLQIGTDNHTEFNNDLFYGEYPNDWELSNVRRELRNVNIEQQDGNHGELHPTTKDYSDRGIPFILANNLGGFKVDIVDCKFIPESVAKKLRIGFSKTGDVLLTHKGTLGRVALCDTGEYPYIILTPQVTYYRVKRTWINKFLFYLFQSTGFQEQLKLIGSGGSTRDYIGLVAQKDLKLLKPSLDEQKRIIQILDESRKEHSDLIVKYQKQIDLMQEYKTSLISKAVTGKIDVREWQSKQTLKETV